MTTKELAEALRPVIKEVVKEAMQSELREILTEAVEIASRPSDEFEVEPSAQMTKDYLRQHKPDWAKDMDNMVPSKGQKAVVAENQSNAVMSVLASTAKSMTATDMSNFS